MLIKRASVSHKELCSTEPRRKNHKDWCFRAGRQLNKLCCLIEEQVDGLDSSQKVLFHMVTKLSEDVKATLDVVKTEMEDISARVNLAIRAVENQTPIGRTTRPNKVKVSKPIPSLGFETPRP